MSRKHPEVAIAYDFDGTLSPGNMQEYDFIPKLGMKKGDFWRDAMQLAKDSDGDPILAYLNLMLRKANANEVEIRRNNFVEYGKGIELFPGVEEWFDRIDAYGKQLGLSVKHYIISSGIREMVEGSPVAKKFERIFASAFAYDQNGVAYAPALAINYTTKTQFLFRINKGREQQLETINEYMPEGERPIPFQHMLYVGDGLTDVPCMTVVKNYGGFAVAVHKPRSEDSIAVCQRLVAANRIDFYAPADYRAGKMGRIPPAKPS